MILDFGPVSFISDFVHWTREQLKIHLFEVPMSQLPNRPSTIIWHTIPHVGNLPNPANHLLPQN
jgi:hypothetical protein